MVSLIAWWKTRDTNLGSSSGYFLAGRSLTWYVIAASLILTNISTEQMIGLNGNAFTHGACVMAWETIASVAMVAMALFFLPRYLKSGITTIPQFLEARFGKNMRSMISLMFLVALTLSFLPFVLYSGAIGMNSLFHVDTALGISTQASIWVMVIALALAGIGFAICGGLKAAATSDAVYGVGLVIGGFLIPVLGMLKLGDGSISAAWETMTTNRPEMLNPVGAADANIPFSTLFTGMLIINLFYWCTNQAIVQRTFGAKNLAESQKGVLAAAFLKIIGVGILVLPGIIAWHLNAQGKIAVSHQDFAYPVLVASILPPWLTGFFAAVMFGAIISSFNGGLNSVTALFSMDLYKPMIRKNASDHEVVTAGRIFGILLIIICVIIAPQIAKAPDGLYTLMRKLMAFFNIPILAIVLLGVLSKRAPALSAYIAVPIGIVFYYWASFVEGGNLFGHQFHWLHVAGINLLLIMGIMYLIRFIKPLKEPYVQVASGGVDITFWKWAKLAGILIILIIIGMYWVLNGMF
ncbi:MAG: solute:sodium symporter family transporter [Kiritimatiellales bacterium]|nr:solute:sodium symporter family transporter [Kiritimatiellales bacterium]